METSLVTTGSRGLSLFNHSLSDLLSVNSYLATPSHFILSFLISCQNYNCTSHLNRYMFKYITLCETVSNEHVLCTVYRDLRGTEGGGL